MQFIIFDLEATCWENEKTKAREINLTKPRFYVPGVITTKTRS